jgi:hypothetical protein
MAELHVKNIDRKLKCEAKSAAAKLGITLREYVIALLKLGLRK